MCGGGDGRQHRHGPIPSAMGMICRRRRRSEASVWTPPDENPSIQTAAMQIGRWVSRLERIAPIWTSKTDRSSRPTASANVGDNDMTPVKIDRPWPDVSRAGKSCIGLDPAAARRGTFDFLFSGQRSFPFLLRHSHDSSSKKIKKHSVPTAFGRRRVEHRARQRGARGWRSAEAQDVCRILVGFGPCSTTRQNKKRAAEGRTASYPYMRGLGREGCHARWVAHEHMAVETRRVMCKQGSLQVHC